MASPTASQTSEMAIFRQVINADEPFDSPEAARAVLGFRFSARDQAQMNGLAAKSRAGRLTREEEEELDTFVRVGRTIGILQKDRRSLKSVARSLPCHPLLLARCQDRNPLPPMPPVHPKILIQREDDTPGGQLRHSHQARIRQRHGNVLVPPHQPRHGREVIANRPMQPANAALDEPEDRVHSPRAGRARKQAAYKTASHVRTGGAFSPNLDRAHSCHWSRGFTNATGGTLRPVRQGAGTARARGVALGLGEPEGESAASAGARATTPPHLPAIELCLPSLFMSWAQASMTPTSLPSRSRATTCPP